MGSLNKVQLIGRVGFKSDIKQLENTLVCNFTVATNSKYKGEEKTEWHKVVSFGKTAEICGKYLDKGSQVYIEGRLQTRSWDKDGEKRYSTEIIVDSLQFLSSRNDTQDTVNNASVSMPAPQTSLEESVPF